MPPPAAPRRTTAPPPTRPRILTLLAAPPADVPPDKLPSDVGELVRSVVAQFGRYGIKPKPVASLVEITDVVEEFAKNDEAPFVLQIIGHGQPGRLQLSEAWTHTYRNDSDAFALDSNRDILGLVARWRGKLAELWLVGCATGADGSRFSATDGTILIFTLSHLLKCPVTAADGTVWPSDFGADGLYAGPARTGNPVPGAPVPAPRVPPADPVAIRRSSPKLPVLPYDVLDVQKLVARQAMHHRHAWRVEKPGEAVALDGKTKKLFGAYATPVAAYDAPRFASPEATFETEVCLHDRSVVKGRGFLVHDARCLVVDFPSVHPSKLLAGETAANETVYLLAADGDARVDELLDAVTRLPPPKKR